MAVRFARSQGGIATLSRRLADALRAASEEPSARARVISVAVPWPAHAGAAPDPLALFAAAAGQDAFYWEQPRKGVAFAAIGSEIALDADAPPDTEAGVDRITAVVSRWRALALSAVTRCDGTQAPPLLGVGGFAFDAGRPPDAAWSGMPRGLVVVPRLALGRRRRDHWIQLQLKVDQAGAVAVDSALEQLASLLSAARSNEILEAGAADRLRPGALELLDDPPAAWWHETVAEITAEIVARRLQKLVLARRLRLTGEDRIDPVATLERLRSRYRQTTVFAYRRGDRCFLGATPETLVSLDNGAIRASAIAGTSPRNLNGRSGPLGGTLPLPSDPKERREHGYVVEAFREALAPVCRRLHVPQAPELLQLPDLQHLHTPIRGELAAPGSVLDLVARLHPTPAVGGVPRDRVTQLLRRYEPFDRGWYAGPLGWLDGDGNGEFIVALRAALLQRESATLYGGCGLVEGSDSAREWDEARLKMESVLWALGAA